MATETQTQTSVSQNRWNVAAQTLLAGFVAWNALLWVAIELGRHSQQFPTGAAQPVAWVVAIGLTSYLLLQRGFKAGYVLTILTALLGVVSLSLIAVGPHGPIPGEPASPALFVVFGPGGYVGFAVILIVATILAWRGHGDVREANSAEQTTA